MLPANNQRQCLHKLCLITTLVATVVLLGGRLNAELHLTSWKDTATPSGTLGFTPRSLPNTPAELSPGHTMEWESALLSAPAGLSWKWRATDATGTDVTGELNATISDVMLAGVLAIQFRIQPPKNSAIVYPLSIRLNSYGESTGNRPDKAAGSHAVVPFLNTNSSTYTANRSKASLPPPLAGSRRIAHKINHGLLTVPAASLDSGTAAIQLGLFTHHGTAIPLGGIVGENVWIYAPKKFSYTAETDSVFYQPAAVNPSPTMATRSAFLTLSAASAEVSISRSRRYEWNTAYDNSGVQPVGERFVFHNVRPTVPRTMNLPFNDLLEIPDVTLRMEFWGRNDSGPAVNPDHFADITLQGVTLPRVSWKGRSAYTASWNVTLPSTAPAPALILDHVVPIGSPFSGGTDLQSLEAVEIDWTGKPRLGNENSIILEIPANSNPQRVSIGGIPTTATIADTILLDVTTPSNPVRIDIATFFSDESGANAVEFEVPTSGGSYFLQLLPTAEAPLHVVESETFTPLADGVELKGIHVRDASMAAVLAPLTNLRGTGYIELDPQAAYNHFGGGQSSPEALRDALAWIVTNASSRVPLPEILLAGHGSLDRANFLGLQSGSQIPPFVTDSVELSGNIRIEIVTDFDYTLLEGIDNLPDASVARIPARTAAELEIAVARQIAHEAIIPQLSSLNRKGLFVIDDEAIFQSDTTRWTNYWSGTGRPWQVLDVDPVTESGGLDGAAERAIIKDALEGPNGGVAYLMYMGHGNTDRWSGHRVMRTQDVASMNTVGQWPLVATFTCLNAAYATPTATAATLSEAWVLTPSRGAIGVISPSGVDYYYPQSQFAGRVMELLELPTDVRPLTTGALLARASIAYLVAFPTQTVTAQGYHLFGDPGASLTLMPVDLGLAGWSLY